MTFMQKMSSARHSRLTIAKEGMPLILLLAALAIALWFLAVFSSHTLLFWIAIAVTILTLTISFMFRNPSRIARNLNDLDIISPADGKIVSIVPVEEPQFLKNRVMRISIFLALPDVHVNWIPVSGVVKYKKNSEGKCLPAFTARASDKNRRVSVGIECKDGFRMTVAQITGFIARRIKCNLTPGQKVERGERYGMIYFGSRVDVFLPPETTVTVTKGDRVYGGITVIGRKAKIHDKNKASAS